MLRSAFGFFTYALRRKQWTNRQSEGDAAILIGETTIPVHSSVIGSESPLLADAFRKSFQKTGKQVYRVHSGSIHSAWRLLELIYLGEYSNRPCPAASIPGMDKT